MKKYIFKDGQEIRGIVVKESGHGDTYYRETDILIDEKLNRYILKDMPEIERVTFVKGIDKDLKKAFVEYKEANERNIKRREEIEIEIRELNKERGELNGKNIETLRNLEDVYKEVSGLYTNKQFLSVLESKTEKYLRDKYNAVEHGISTANSSAYAYGTSLSFTIPVDMVRHPQEGDWDLFLEYDNSLHSYGEDMAEEVLRIQYKVGFDLEATKEAITNLKSLSLSSIDCRTSVGDKTATLDVVVNLDIDIEQELTEEYLDEILADIRRIV